MVKVVYILIDTHKNNNLSEINLKHKRLSAEKKFGW